MALLNDIRTMQGEGKTEQEIIAALRQQGISAREISEALSQSKIKEAVGGEANYPQQAADQAPQGAQQEMTPSLGAQPVEEYAASPAQEVQQGAPQYQDYQQYAPAQQGAPQYQDYQQYPQQQYQQPAMGSISPDTITEISEQVVTEKLSPMRKDIEKVMEMRTTVETKMEVLDERLKRIEKIIDRLQLSIMQKVGEYITNIDDIKKEIVETQKSFKAMVPNSPNPPGAPLSREERAEKPKKFKEYQEQTE